MGFLALPLKTRLIIGFLAIASFLLTLFSYTTPTTRWLDPGHNLSLIRVSPHTEPGPIFILGIFGSCGTASNASNIKCVDSFFKAKYDLSVLPSNVPKILILPHVFRFLFMLAFLLWIFGVLFIFISAKYVPVKKMGKFDIDANIKVLTATAFLTGFLIWLVAAVFFLKAADDFNTCLSLGGAQAPPLSAKIGPIIFLMMASYLCCAGLYYMTRS